MVVTATVRAILMSSTVKADNDSAVDQINITVPVSCTMSGTGMAKKSVKPKEQKPIEQTLWDAANKLRGKVEPAEYKIA